MLPTPRRRERVVDRFRDNRHHHHMITKSCAVLSSKKATRPGALDRRAR
jgi:hypothetical protein